MRKLFNAALSGLFILMLGAVPAAHANPLEDLFRGIFNGGGGFHGQIGGNQDQNTHLHVFVNRFNPGGAAVNELRGVLFEPENQQGQTRSWSANINGRDVWGTIRVNSTTRGPNGVCRSFDVYVNWISQHYNSGRIDRRQNGRSVRGEACLAVDRNGNQFWHIGQRFWS
jgi:hypothetical protein